MRILRKLFYSILVIVLLIVLGLLIYLTSQKPQYNGTVQLKGLKKQVEILYDFYGIPHIYATNEEDAYFALGYVQAQDRLFQMEMTRRVASGRLSEVLGADFIKVDAFFKTLGLEDHADESAKLFLNSDSLPYQRAANAYLAGLNQFIDKGRTPVEFVMLGISREKFTQKDLFMTTEFMAFNFAMGFRTDALMSFIKKKLGVSYYRDLSTKYVEGTERNPVFEKIDTSVTKLQAFNTIDKILDQLPVSPLVGSNAWVVAPSHTKKGKVLFANDTHIGYSQPSVWYEAHIEYPGYSFYGNYLGGFPFAPIGHTRDLSFGITMFENDDLDFYSERIKPGDSSMYWSDGNWIKFSVKQKKIKVKNSTDVDLTVRNSRHGPLVQDVVPEWKAVTNEAVSAWWTHLKFPNDLLHICYQMNHSQNMEQVKESVSKIVSPGLNIMYGDMQGNIAWWTAAKLVKRSPLVDPVIIQDGSNSRYDPTGYYDFSENPKSENPPEGFIFTANNQPDSMPGGILYPGYYVPEDRAKRIGTLLRERDKFSIEDMQRIDNDALSPVAPLVAHAIMDAISSQMENKSQQHYAAAKKLLIWNGDHQLHDVAPVIYYKLLYNLLAEAMQDELGEENFKVFLGTHVMKNSLLSFVQNDSSTWWNNVTTADVRESRNAIFDKAYDETISQLIAQLGTDVDSWEWGRVHLLEHVHPIGKKKPFNLFFNVGPYAVPGGNEVINQIAFDLNKEGIYKAKFGPAMRIVLDFSDIENSKSVLPTGQSGNVMSPYYYDQAVMYNSGKSRKQKMNRMEIESNKSGRVLLEPLHSKQ